MFTSIQTRVAQSRWALPWTSLYAVIVCLLAGFVPQMMWQQFLLFVLSTLFIAELNNAYALIRIYSRMVSCSFLLMTTMAGFLLQSVSGLAVQLGLIVFYLYLLKAYQAPHASDAVFVAFFAIGMVSLLFVQILFFVPLLWVLLAVNMLAFSPRTFIASLLGIVAPYWFAVAYCLYAGTMTYIPTHLAGLAVFAPPFALGSIDTSRLVTAALVLLLALVGGTHFVLYSYQDKIRTRMNYELFIAMDVFCFAGILLQPQHFDSLLAMSIVTTAPLIGHYAALSHSKISNISFILLSIIILALTGYNLWISYTTY